MFAFKQKTAPEPSDALRAPAVTTSAIDPSLTASKLLKQCRNMNLADSAELLLTARAHMLESRSEQAIDGKSTQISDTVLLPDRGTAYFVSDLEGRVDLLVALLEKEKIIERWRLNNPHDQVVLCVLGDCIDRSATSSLLMEFLLELKCRQGLSRHIILLPGNHELFLPLQETSREGFYAEVVAGRRSYNDPSSLESPAVREVAELYMRQRALYSDPGTNAADLHQARSGMWLLFNEIFRAMPRTIVSPHGLYAAHAGFPVRGAFQSLLVQTPKDENDTYNYFKALANLPDEPVEQDYLLAPPRIIDDIIWSDVDPHLDSSEAISLVGLNDRGPKGTPGPGVSFGDLAFKRFSAVADLSLFIRGHQANTPRHPEVNRIAPKVWSYRDILTIANGKDGGFAKVDLRIKSPRPSDVTIGQASLPRGIAQQFLRFISRL